MDISSETISNLFSIRERNNYIEYTRMVCAYVWTPKYLFLLSWNPERWKLNSRIWLSYEQFPGDEEKEREREKDSKPKWT